MKIGLIVEGKHNKTEKEVLPLLIDKIYEVRKPAKVKRCGQRGDLFCAKKVCGLIEYLLCQHPDISKVLVCIDAECNSINKLNESVKKIEKEIKKSFENIIIHYCIVVHALETWLATDYIAVSEYYKIDEKKVEKDISIKIQKECNPKDFLKKMLGNKFDYIRDDVKIAKKIDIERIAKRNDSFAYFKKVVLDP